MEISPALSTDTSLVTRPLKVTASIVSTLEDALVQTTQVAAATAQAASGGKGRVIDRLA